MAATLTNDGELTTTYFSFPISKMEEDANGNLYVYGKATDGSVDSDEQIIDTDFSSKAVRDWLNDGANIRVQHNAQRDPAGVGIEAHTDADGATWVKSLIVEPTAKSLVKVGALRAYSVGIARPKIVRDSVARGGRIVDGQIIEISIVDRPANKNCGVQLVKSDQDGHAEWVGKSFGDAEVITKVDSGTFSPGDLAKLLEHRRAAEERVAEKRQMDPSVGGGVDRDKIPAADFAGRDRSFPIVTPGDVSDAASSIGRAGGSNYSSDKLKSNIIRIARRKGDAFVAELPESWKKELGIGAKKADDDVEVEKASDDTVEMKADEPDVDDDKDTDDDDSEAKPDVTKGSKSCKGCGAGYDADSKLRRCEKCNMKLPKANKGGKPVVVKDDDVVCPGCGAKIDEDHNYCPECGKKVPASALNVEKNHDYVCLGCGRELDKGERFCPGCGKENPGYLSEADSKVKSATPGDAVNSPAARDVKPIPEHREPDGIAMEHFERDAGMTDGDEAAEIAMDTARSPEMLATIRMKSVGIPADMGALHDLTCPAFHPDAVDKAHPGVTVTGIDTAAWQQKALDMAAGAPIEEARETAKMWQHALTLKGSDEIDVRELREEAHKAFKDANMGPGSFPTPTELTATRFRRPVLTAGQAKPGTSYAGPNTHPVPTGTIEATDFRRDALTAGQAADSPSNKGQSPIIAPAPQPPGMSRTSYRDAQRDAAQTAMSAMHDHIAQTFPNICAMEGPGFGGQPPVGARSVPLPVGKSDDGEEITKAEGDTSAEDTGDEAMDASAKTPKKGKKAKKARMAGKSESLNEDDILNKAAVTPDVIKSAVIEATAPLVEQLEMLTKAFEDERQKTRRLEETLETMGGMADPREAPFKGVALQTGANNKSVGASHGALTVAEVAEQTQRSMMEILQEQARTSSDPAQREAAWTQLYKMSGLPVSSK